MHIHSYLFGSSGLAEITGKVDDPYKTRKMHVQRIYIAETGAIYGHDESLKPVISG